MKENFKFLETELMDTKKKKKLVFGYGVNDWEYRSYINGKQVWQYKLWSGVLERCCSSEYNARHTSYTDVDCDPRWFSFKEFLADIVKVDNYEKFSTEGWHLDKDILVKGNKTYCLSTVCFVPQQINCLLTKSNKVRGKHPIGVHYNKRQGKYTASVSDGGGRKIYLGVFDEPKIAFLAYKKEKEKVIKKVAEQWRGIISESVYQALIKYEVNIND